eukprot:gene14096-14215_t
MQSFWFEHALLPDGWARNVEVQVEQGKIINVTHDVDLAGRAVTKGAAISGLASLHSHTFQRGMAGLAEMRGPKSDSFWSWRQVMYRFTKALTADDIESIAAFAFMEMLERGFTSVGEFHYLHHDVSGQPYANLAEHCERIAAAAAQSGIGLTLLPSFYAQSGFGGLPPSEGQCRFINDAERFSRLVEGARRAVAELEGGNVGIAPHSLRAVTPESLAHVLAAHPAGPVHIHIAEQTREVEECLAWSGQRPVDWLLAHMDIDPRWCLIHATHMSAEETARFARSGAVAGLCPITEANLGDGIFPAPDFDAAGGRYGVGTDSNVEISAAGELKQLEYSQRLGLRARNVMATREGQSTGQALYAAALQGGAQALGRHEGKIATGFSADFVVLEIGHPSVAHLAADQWLDAYVFVAGSKIINQVIVRGQRWVDEGQHRAHQAIASRFARTMKRLMGL